MAAAQAACAAAPPPSSVTASHPAPGQTQPVDAAARTAGGTAPVLVDAQLHLDQQLEQRRRQRSEAAAFATGAQTKLTDAYVPALRAHAQETEEARALRLAYEAGLKAAGIKVEGPPPELQGAVRVCYSARVPNPGVAPSSDGAPATRRLSVCF